MIFQLHYQNPQNLNETIWVAQGVWENNDQVIEWISDVRSRTDEDMPSGWQYVMCWEDSPLFCKRPMREGE